VKDNNFNGAQFKVFSSNNQTTIDEYFDKRKICLSEFEKKLFKAIVVRYVSNPSIKKPKVIFLKPFMFFLIKNKNSILFFSFFAIRFMVKYGYIHCW
jgi:hypothetical protein